MKDNKDKTFGKIDEYTKEIAEKTNEIKLIQECLKELEGVNVSRETFTNNSGENTDIKKESDNQELKNKLKFCKGLCGVDDLRVKMELENIIRNL